MFRVLRISDAKLSASERADYAQRYADLRISGLEQSPHAFSTTIEVEKQMETHAGLRRLQEPQKTIFVCVNQETDDWVGQVTLIGPLNRSEYDASFQVLPGSDSSRSPSLQDDPRGAYWHMTALYVDDRMRGRGLARLLCEECFAFIGSGQLRILIKPDNAVVVQMYKRMGFEVLSEKTTLFEAIHASRDGFDRLPHNAASSPLYTTRTGLVMIKQVVP